LPLEGVGSYRTRTVAYRNDYCVSCNAPCRALLVRSFKAYQLYYIPIVPLGFWREWQCSECGRDPHVYSRASRRAWWMVVLLTGFFAIAGVIASFDQQDSAVTVWLMRLALPAVFFTLLWLALRNKPDRALRDKLRSVNPDRSNNCALCGGAFILDHEWRCSQCGAERMELGLSG
jgi:hypothetical protein